MKSIILSLLAALLALPAPADTVVAVRTIRSQAVLTEADLKVIAQDTAGAINRLADVVGKESRVVLYAGRPILHDHIGSPALVERNGLVQLVYETQVMRIVAEGRSLGRAGLGERIRVLNIESRKTVSATVTGPGQAEVSGE